jgi:putative phosphoribosyl transferase
VRWADEVEIRSGDRRLPGTLTMPRTADGIVLFAHGSGSSRHSPRNRMVADVLLDAGFGTLLFDLLDEREGDDREKVFDIPLLGARLVDATRWVRDGAELELPLGYFGASTGAGAALWAAAELDDVVGAVVSRGGRPDLAAERLDEVRSPTLLVVGGRDDQVIDLNRRAQDRLTCPTALEVIPGATHLFEEPGALEQVARLAAGWFGANLAGDRAA